jgi:hypothetical protein
MPDSWQLFWGPEPFLWLASDEASSHYLLATTSLKPIFSRGLSFGQSRKAL